MFTVFLVLILIVCFLLILVVMVQNPKGGGLSSTLGGSQQLGGVQKTTDFLDKSTWTLGAILVILILLSGLSFNNGTTAVEEDTAPATEKPATEKPATKAATPAPAATTTSETPVTIDPNKK